MPPANARGYAEKFETESKGFWKVTGHREREGKLEREEWE